MKRNEDGSGTLEATELRGLEAVFGAISDALNRSYYTRSADGNASAGDVRNQLHSAHQILDTILHGARSAPTTDQPEVRVIDDIEAQAEHGVAP